MASGPPELDPAIDRLLAEAHMRMRQGDLEAAASRLAQAKQSQPEHPAVLEMEGDLAFTRGRYGQAEGLYRRAREGDPRNARLEEKFATALVKKFEPQFSAQIGPDDNPWSRPVARPPYLSGLASGLLPGIGQFYNGDLLKGGLVLAGYVFLAMGLVGNVLRVLKQFQNAGTPVNATTILAGMGGTGTGILVLMVLLWLYAVIDAAWMARVNTQEARAREMPLPPAPPRPNRP
jgi:hypothetical protein